MGVGIAGYALANLFASGTELFFFLMPFSIIDGIGSSFYHPLDGSVLSQTWPAHSIGRAMGINGSTSSYVSRSFCHNPFDNYTRSLKLSLLDS